MEAQGEGQMDMSKVSLYLVMSVYKFTMETQTRRIAYSWLRTNTFREI